MNAVTELDTHPFILMCTLNAMHSACAHVYYDYISTCMCMCTRVCVCVCVYTSENIRSNLASVEIM